MTHSTQSVDGSSGGDGLTCRQGQALGAGGEWVLDRLLHRDACGEVWLAHDRRGAQPPRAFRIFAGPGARDRLDRRQGALWAIMHKLGNQPNVVRLLDIGAAEQGPASVASEYVPGGSLRDWLTRGPQRRPPLEKTEVMRGVVSALADAHRQGISHGALSAAKVLLTRPPQARAKVSGFGLCGAADPVAASDSLYRPPERVGAPGPEGPEGPEAARPADDVFALGVIWYQLLVERLERPPYDFADALAAEGHDAYSVRLIARCLAGPGRRFASAVELYREFGAVGLPEWPPVPAGYFDVSGIVREYLRGRGAASG